VARGENPASRRHRLDDQLRLLAPFDPIVWDRRRFELFWGWAYRFEAYTPAPKRVRGYYALPLLWQGDVKGWGNLAVEGGRLQAQVGWHDRAPQAAAPGSRRWKPSWPAAPPSWDWTKAPSAGVRKRADQVPRCASSACATSAKPWPRSPSASQAGQCCSWLAKRSRLATPTLCVKRWNIGWSLVLSPT
jgi:hypothetical protein